MKEDVTDALISAIRARCACGGNCQCSLGNYVKRQDAHRAKLPALRLVPNCGSLLKANEPNFPPGPHAA